MTELTRAPNLAALYFKAITSPMRRGDELPGTRYVRTEIDIDRDQLAAYNRVCGFRLRDELPLTYLHTLGFPVAMRLMTDPGFPFPLAGLVHVTNTITQHRPLLLTETLTQQSWLENLRPHPRGRQFDIVTETSVGDEVAWHEVSTYLRREHSGERRGDRPVAVEDSGPPAAVWRLPGDLGRRYAAVSGDRNPIHLHSLAAKAFGFPRAIAHGMWLKARCLAAFDGRLPGSCTVRVEFRTPTPLPSTVEFHEHGSFDFAVRARSGKPHLTGAVTG
jgi:acyl dehydratase